VLPIGKSDKQNFLGERGPIAGESRVDPDLRANTDAFDLGHPRGPEWAISEALCRSKIRVNCAITSNVVIGIGAPAETSGALRP
jgi:hypothetical protein